MTNKCVLKPKTWLKASLIFSFKSLNLLPNIRWLRKCRVNTHQHVPYEKNIALKMALNLNLRVSARIHAQLSYIHTCASRMEEGTGKFLHIYGSCFKLQIDPSGWKGYISNILGADISLPTAWRQVSETWFQKRPPGRNLVEHRLVQRSGAQFLLSMVI